MKKKYFVLISFIITFCSYGVQTGWDDQKIIRAEDLSLANPKPIARDFVKNNENHKVLIAVIDTGVDYNHPELLDKIHFDLDSNGMPIAAGLDLMGDDVWPYPALIRTSAYDLNNLEAQDSKKLINNAIGWIKKSKKWLHPMRNQQQEDDHGSFHGTHVSALASFDESRIGVVPYRLKVWDKSDYLDFYDYLEKVLVNASARGVRIVNLSMSIPFEKPQNGNLLEYYQLMTLRDDVTKLIASYPEILFVGSAGNSGDEADGGISLIDGVDSFSFPCGVNADNVLCVGALMNDGKSIASWSTKIAMDVPMVHVLGSSVFSARPTNYCRGFGRLHVWDLDFILYHVQEQEDFEKEIREIVSDCEKYDDYMFSTGTSMSAPIVARSAAKILLEDGSIKTGNELLIKLLESSKVFIDPIYPQTTIYKPAYDKPSWYAKFANDE